MHPDRRPLIAGNWKMNGSQAMTRELIAGIAAGRPAGPEVAVMPPFPYLAAAKEAILATDVAASVKAGLVLGAQDLSPRGAGAHTGDVAAGMLRDCGVELVLVGHSERRQDHGETDAVVAAKFVAAIDAGLIPVLCVGETLDQRDAGDAEAVIKIYRNNPDLMSQIETSVLEDQVVDWLLERVQVEEKPVPFGELMDQENG